MSVQVSHKRRRTAVVAAVPCCVLLASMGYIAVATLRAQIPVTGGYYLFRADSNSIVLCNPRDFVIVEEQICEIGVVDRMIVGRTVSPGADAYPGWSFPVGYFIVDLQTGKVTSGMTKEDFTKSTGGFSPILYSPFAWTIRHW